MSTSCNMSEFTEHLFLMGERLDYELNLMVKPNTDIDGTFKAWCLDEEEFINVDGGLFYKVDVATDGRETKA